MPTIKVGDVVYCLFDWPDRQVRAVVTKVGSMPNYPKSEPRLKRYTVVDDAGFSFNVGHTRYKHGKGNIRTVRRTPFPDVPIWSTPDRDEEEE